MYLLLLIILFVALVSFNKIKSYLKPDNLNGYVNSEYLRYGWLPSLSFNIYVRPVIDDRNDDEYIRKDLVIVLDAFKFLKILSLDNDQSIKHFADMKYAMLEMDTETFSDYYFATDETSLYVPLNYDLEICGLDFNKNYFNFEMVCDDIDEFDHKLNKEYIYGTRRLWDGTFIHKRPRKRFASQSVVVRIFKMLKDKILFHIFFKNMNDVNLKI